MPAVSLHSLSGNEEPQPTATGGSLSSLIHPPEALEKMRQVIRRHARTIVDDGDDHVLIARLGSHHDVATRWHVAQGIAE